MLYVSPNFAGKTLKTLNEMRRNERLCDITVVIGSYKFPAHKSVLVANSSYMEQEIEKLQGQTLTIGLSLSNPAVFAELLNFLYLGEIELTQDKLAEVMLLASFLQIPEIIKLTSEFVRMMQSANTSINTTSATDNNPSDAHVSGGEQDVNEDGAVNVFEETDTTDTSSIKETNVEKVVSSTPKTKSFSSTAENGLVGGKPSHQFKCSACKMTFTNQLDQAMHTSKYCKNRKKFQRLLQSGKRKTARLQVQTFSDNELEEYSKSIEMYIEHVENESVKKFCSSNAPGKKRKCLACGFMCTKMAEFRHHVKQHTGDAPFGCLACSKSFKRSDILKAHLLRSSRNACGQYLVDRKSSMGGLFTATKTAQLAKNFENLVSTTLENIETGENLPKYECNECAVEFLSFEEFSSHQKDEHDTVEEIKCPICGLVFGKESWLDSHLEYHRSEPKNTADFQPAVKTKVFQCILCEDVFRTEDAYKVHRRKNCADCCRFCKRVFKSRYHLDRHIRSHIKDKPCKCPVCNKGYKHPERLDIHMKAKHAMKIPKDLRQAQSAHVIEVLDELSTELLDEMGIGHTTELSE